MDLGNLDFIEIFKSSFTLMILAVCSIIAVAFIIERSLFYRRSKVDSNSLLSKIKLSIENNNFEEAITSCERDNSPIGTILRVGLLNRSLPYHQLDELIEAAREEEKVKLDRYLGILGTLGNSSPFIGLFGTVVGIIKAFGDLAASGSGGPTVVAAGIAEALVATAAGLAVAIPCVMFFNAFMRKVKNISVEMESAAKKFLIILSTANTEENTTSRRR